MSFSHIYNFKSNNSGFKLEDDLEVFKLHYSSKTHKKYSLAQKTYKFAKYFLWGLKIQRNAFGKFCLLSNLRVFRHFVMDLDPFNGKKTRQYTGANKQIKWRMGKGVFPYQILFNL